MENKCPKCGAKLSVFYLKPECPKCGCNIMNYNMEERLEADAEWAKAEKLLAKFKKKKKADKEESKDENPA
jgi:predicted  nucleic acid-binding Zn-ribbon protein